MPPRPAVYGLPPELLEELNTRLVANRFSGYTELSEWLKSEGYEIGRSAVHNHGRKLEAEFEQAMADSRRMNELAKALVRADPDEQNALLEANERIAHESLMRLLLELRRVEDDPGMLAKNLPKITRAIADLGRTTIGRSKWQAEREAEVVRKTRQQDAEKLQELAATGALSLDRDTVRQTIRELYGVSV
ncbi:MAG: phage protein Gp27 family protein [Methylotetracoccus sp.]